MGIGNKLTKLMKQQDTNANELATKAGVPPTTIYSLIRRDSNRVDIDSLIKIAKALGVTAEYFCNEIDDEPANIAAHFDGSEFTEEQLNRIKEFARFIKQENQ